jgi:hypothetical protein
MGEANLGRIWTFGVVFALFTTGFRAFAESGVPLGEGPFPLGEGFTERKLSATASRRHSTGEELFAESTWGPSR